MKPIKLTFTREVVEKFIYFTTQRNVTSVIKQLDPRHLPSGAREDMYSVEIKTSTKQSAFELGAAWHKSMTEDNRSDSPWLDVVVDGRIEDLDKYGELTT
jgi:hypothetical protein